jgi:hypothetical protein
MLVVPLQLSNKFEVCVTNKKLQGLAIEDRDIPFSITYGLCLCESMA